eukprot:gene10142-8977_t
MSEKKVLTEPCVIRKNDGPPCGCTASDRDAKFMCIKCGHGN